MKRLTERVGNEIYVECGDKIDITEKGIIDILKEKLAAYEDTGLEPEEVEHTKSALMGKSIAEIKEINGLSVERMIELANAEPEGRMIVLPCKVGDNVYLLWPCGKHGKSVSEMVVKHIDIDLMPDIEFACRKEKGTSSYWCFKPKDIGKTVFLTREEAEKALEGMNND